MIDLTSEVSQQRQAAIQRRMMVSFERAIAVPVMQELRRIGVASSRAYEASPGTFDTSLSILMDDHSRRMTRIITAADTMVANTFGIMVIHAGSKGSSVRERKDAQGQLDTAIDQFIRRTVGNKVTGIVGTTKDQIRSVVAAGVGDGIGVDAMARQIRKVMGDEVPRWRSQMIARTESHGASQMGSLSGAATFNFPMMKRWVSTKDARTREDHLTANGQAVALTESFNLDGSSLAFPGDPTGAADQVINCRCVMTYQRARG
jgi:uncharacterized protein with gpF-like domain